jgi:demethylmenaquinone methyltransferase/2-methoxy-6-polyprenyl-1,4-benzoquinol methylase
MFGEIAPWYDLLNHLLSLNVDRYWRRKTVRMVPLSDEGLILDLCTGTGDLALAYDKASGGKSRIVAADFSHPMLVLARGKAKRAGNNGWLTFVEADAQRLPLPDDLFQIVCVAFGLRNVADTDRGLREMVRVCRPGGNVVVLEFSEARQPFRTLYSWYLRYLLPRVGQALSRSRHGAYNYLPASVGEFPSAEALLERMRDAGLSKVRFRRLTFGIATVYMGTK